MSKTCLVCGNTRFELIYKATLIKCELCGFITANMNISPEILRQTYTENYFKGEEYLDYIRDKDILQTNFKRRLKTIFKIINHSDIKNVAEIGCAYGFFAEVINNELKNISYKGYDIVPEAIRYGVDTLKQNLYCTDYLLEHASDKVTDIFMWDVIEHLPNPEEFIKKSADELETGGRIYITTGDIERMVPRIQKAKWRMIHPPSHLHYFSKNTLSQLLENNGFKVLKVTYPPVYRSVRLIFYSLFMLRKKYPKLVEKIYKRIPPKMNIAINTFDIMFLIAVKK